MALKLKVQGEKFRLKEGRRSGFRLKIAESDSVVLTAGSDSLSLKRGESDSISIKASEGTPIVSNPYTGATDVIPSEQVQTLETAGKELLRNITVQPIPSNYGKITYNGSTILVS